MKITVPSDNETEKPECTAQKCNSAALWYVSRGLKTEGQVRDYLARKDFSQEEIANSLGMLKEYNYIDDRHYCRVYYNEACRKGRGRRRIEQELEQKKVSRSIIRETLDEYLSEDNPDYNEILSETLTERDRAMIIVDKMVKEQRLQGKPLDNAFCAKVGRRLTAKGYAGDVIYYAIGRVMKESNDE